MKMKNLIIWSIIGIGISSITVQLVTIREFLTQFHGNEITISLVLFCWLIMTGLGSLGAKPFKYISITFYSFLILLTALWPLAQILAIRYFREILFIHGSSPGFYQILFYIIVTITPYCLLTGFILPYALEVLKVQDQGFTSGRLYMMDNIGDILGGIFFSFILVYWLKPFKTIAVTSALLIMASIFLSAQKRRYSLFIGAFFMSAFFYGNALSSHFEQSTLSSQYGDIARYIESPFGRIIITQEGTQHTFWESGIPLYSDADVANSEEKIHYPLSQLERTQDILLISGGLGETLEEVLKYHPKHIDYVELDPYLTDVAQESGFLKKTPPINIINQDARRFIKNTSQRYDAIIMDLPDPDIFQINRFFTVEFFSMIKKILKQEGILSFGMEYSMNYVSEIRRKKLSIIHNTAKQHFQNVTIIPGGEAYFLCRDGEIFPDIPARLAAQSISTRYIEGFYGGNVTDERIREFQNSIDPGAPINMDFKPSVMQTVFKEWFFKHGTMPNGFLLIFFCIILFYFFFMKKEEYVLFTTGSATMGLEMLIIFIFQVIHGYIYLKIGAIVTVFLLGLLPGAVMGNIFHERRRRQLILSELILLGFLFLFLIWYHFFQVELHQLVFLIYCFFFSFFCGFQFPVITGILGEKKGPAAGCFAADLAGAAVGTFLVGTILIPLMGVPFAISFLILLKISSLSVQLALRT
ncbi:MAG: fused MFS/spermidine synthase [Deltaproteobacteria bacterium]|nr:fused MFS/spermidine synthase [Deltaproteobacteria bacterium]